MIPAIVAKFQLERLPAQRDAGELMAQTDSENWLASHKAAYVVDRIRAGLGVARAVRQKNAVRLQSQHIFRGGLRRDNCHLAAFSPELAQDVLLDAEIVSDHVETGRLIFYADNFVGQVRALARLP